MLSGDARLVDVAVRMSMNNVCMLVPLFGLPLVNRLPALRVVCQCCARSQNRAFPIIEAKYGIYFDSSLNVGCDRCTSITSDIEPILLNEPRAQELELFTSIDIVR